MNKILPENKLAFIQKMFATNESPDFFKESIADFIPALIYIYDARQEKIRFINKKAPEFLGYSVEEIESWNNDLLNMVFEDDKDLVRSELANFSILNDGASRFYYSRFKHKVKNWRYFLTQGIILDRDIEGKASSLLFIAQDITEEMAQEESKALKTLFKETEQLLHFGTWSWTATTDLLEWSDGMYTILDYEQGLEKDDITNSFFHNHIPEPYRTMFIREMLSFSDEKTEFEFTYPLTTGKGKQKIVSTKGKYIHGPDGKLIKIIGVTHDITSQSKIFKDLSDYKQAMMDKEKFLGSGSWEYDVQQKQMSWSDGKYRLFGYDTEKTSGLPNVSTELYQKHVTESEFKKLTEIWSFLETHCSDEFTWNYELLTVQGERKVIESYARVLKDQTGHTYKIIGASRDITRMREYEESLKRKIEELDRSNKELEEFAYIASHDLQEPLRKITSFSERLKERAKQELSEESIIYLDRMLVGTSNMRLLIDNLLEFSRTSRHNHHFERTDLNHVMEHVKAELELKIEETGALINSTNLPVITAIPSQLQQLLTNLISNAIKFRKQGTAPEIFVQSTPLTKQEIADLRLHENQPYHKIIVIDNGIGFEQEYSNRIFQIFQRLHGKSEYPGSGIGLAICKKIVENHHGLISAESEPGKGATFNCILPETQP